MGFRFRLERVLGLRRTELDELRLRMGRLRGEQLEARQALRVAIEERRAYARRCSDPLEGGHTPLQLQSRFQTAASHARRVEQSQAALDEVNARIDALRDELMEAHRRVKILERLREKRLADHLEEIEAQERKLLDDIHRRRGRMRFGRSALPARCPR
jgi:flagellar FliJ protein